MTISKQHTGESVGNIMRGVLMALLPGVVAQTYFFGFTTLLNIALCMFCCVGFEALALRWRGRDIQQGLADSSAVVTAVLIGLALPTYSAWWLAPIACGVAILLAKHAYGGIGHNLFNPAMAGYALLLVCFPAEMTQWAAPRGAGAVDGTTMATALHIVRENHSQLISDMMRREPQFGSWGGRGWEWCNIGFLAGGLFLLHKKYVTWHAPVGMLGTLALCAALFYDNGSSASAGTPLYHLFTGASMLCAFFIVTDPVSSPTTRRGRLLAGILVGGLTFLFRYASNYPDGVAFAVLTMNFVAPLLDQYTQPRTLGRGKKPQPRETD